MKFENVLFGIVMFVLISGFLVSGYIVSNEFGGFTIAMIIGGVFGRVLWKFMSDKHKEQWAIGLVAIGTIVISYFELPQINNFLGVLVGVAVTFAATIILIKTVSFRKTVEEAGDVNPGSNPVLMGSPGFEPGSKPPEGLMLNQATPRALKNYNSSIWFKKASSLRYACKAILQSYPFPYILTAPALQNLLYQMPDPST